MLDFTLTLPCISTTKLDIVNPIFAPYWDNVYNRFCEFLCDFCGYFLPSMFLTSWNVRIAMFISVWLGQKHVRKEVATEITQKFTETVIYVIPIRRKNRIHYI